MSAGPPALVPADPRALADLATFVARARRVDPDGAVRLFADGDVLAVTACALRGADLPTALGLRALALAVPARLDTTVSLGAVAERLARTTERLPVPPSQVFTAPWAGLAPPRSGWTPAPDVPAAHLLAAAEDGAARITGGEPRAVVWSTPVLLAAGPVAGQVQAGLAWAASVLGFLVDGEQVAVARAGRWVRLSTTRGHLLGRPPSLL